MTLFELTPFDTYVFILCLVVFVTLTVLFTAMIGMIAKMKLEMIHAGLDDDRIITEWEKKQHSNKAAGLIWNLISSIICIAFILLFLFSVYLGKTTDKAPNGIPSIKVVMSGSMSFKNEKNKYLFENELNDQMQTFDLIIVRHKPEEGDLKLYDIVVYQMEDGDYIIHRIVGIEEPNDKHPDQRYFLLQGDAVSNADVFPVLYSQIQGIYQGERIPFVGSFVTFMQSPAGWLAIMLVVASMIITPILEAIFRRAEKKRLDLY